VQVNAGQRIAARSEVSAEQSKRRAKELEDTERAAEGRLRLLRSLHRNPTVKRRSEIDVLNEEFLPANSKQELRGDTEVQASLRAAEGATQSDRGGPEVSEVEAVRREAADIERIQSPREAAPIRNGQEK